MCKTLFDDPPALHTWDNGQTWNTGGFSGPDLEWLWRFATAIPSCAIAETGAGCSTLAFLAARPRSVLSISNDPELNVRIRGAATDLGLGLDVWRCLEGRSEMILQAISCAGQAEQVDLALIDGGHGWPTVFVDFHFMNLMLHAGSVLIIDDLELHSVGELARFLTRQPGWEWLATAPCQKAIAIRKLTDELYLPDWGAQPYIVEQSSKRPFGIVYWDLVSPTGTDPEGTLPAGARLDAHGQLSLLHRLREAWRR